MEDNNLRGGGIDRPAWLIASLVDYVNSFRYRATIVIFLVRKERRKYLQFVVSTRVEVKGQLRSC